MGRREWASAALVSGGATTPRAIAFRRRALSFNEDLNCVARALCMPKRLSNAWRVKVCGRKMKVRQIGTPKY